MGLCAWARVSAAPLHSRLGCWGVCVFVCTLRWCPATRGWRARCGGVCLGPGFGCAPPLLAGVLGCAFLSARSACVPPLLARVCGVGVCAWARVSAAPRHPWLGGWGVCAFVSAQLVPRHSWLRSTVRVCVRGLGLRLRPATPGWGVVACVCLCARSACTPPLLAGVCCLGVCASARVSAAPRHSWVGCWGVCACVRAELVPRHSWLRCTVRVCLRGFGLRLRPATPGWGVGACVCLCARSACTPPLLPEVCCVGVCASARVSAAPRHSWLGCWDVCAFACALLLYPGFPGWGVWCGCVCLGSGFGCAPPLLAGVSGCVCACMCAPLVPHHSWLGFVVCGFGVAWHLSLCCGSLCVVRAARVCVIGLRACSAEHARRNRAYY